MLRSRISVILPFRNAARTLRAAVESILAQTCDDLLLIAIDDGSTDGSLELMRNVSDGRLVVLSDGASRGLPARLNEAIGVATRRHSPEFIARMDADDIAHPERFAAQMALMEADSTIDLVGCGIVVLEGHERIAGCRRPPSEHETICRSPFRRFPLFHPTWFGRRAWFERHPYDELARRSQDYQLLREAYTSSRFANLPRLLLAYDETERHLRKAVSSRITCTRNLWRRGVEPRELLPAIVGSAGMLAGSLADVAIAATGRPDLGGLRLGRLRDEEHREWRQILDGRRPAASAATTMATTANASL